jgi:hypothetical protein
MDMRAFGHTGMHLSVLAFGCGAIGGLMVRGDPLDQERSIRIIRRRPASGWSESASSPAGRSERHPIASPPPEPIGSAMTYDADVARAQPCYPW